jgi:hypothetical protein
MGAKRRLAAVAATAVLAFCLVLAPATGATQTGWETISTRDLKELLDSGEKVYLVNTLPRIIHDVRHIEGSLNIPVGKVNTSSEMPGDKGALIVFYCLGPG